MLLSLLLLVACTPSPSTQAAEDYVTRLQPTLIENSFLADRLLSLSARIYNKQADAASLQTTWRAEIVPLAEHLHDQVSFVSPPREWAAEHTELVDIWGDRAEAYRSLSVAIEQGDPESWKEARELADSVKLREEGWFRDVNQRLAPDRLVVDAFP